MSFRTTPVAHPAITRPPKHASSAAAVAAAAAASQTSAFDTGSASTVTSHFIPPTAVGPASLRSPSSRAKPPPPSLSTPQQYNNQFPSLFDGPTNSSRSNSPITEPSRSLHHSVDFILRDPPSLQQNVMSDHRWMPSGQSGEGFPPIPSLSTEYALYPYKDSKTDSSSQNSMLQSTYQKFPPIPQVSSSYQFSGGGSWDNSPTKFVCKSAPELPPYHDFDGHTTGHLEDFQKFVMPGYETSHLLAQPLLEPTQLTSASSVLCVNQPPASRINPMPQAQMFTSGDSAFDDSSSLSESERPASSKVRHEVSESRLLKNDQLIPSLSLSPPRNYACSPDQSVESSQSGNDPESTKLSSAPIRVRAIISGWKAGTIIGRQGAVISHLRRECNCKISISDDPSSPDRALTVSGPAAMVWQALKKVCYLLSAAGNTRKELNEENLALGRETLSEVFAEESEDSATVNLMLAVPSALCGCLIGRRGSQIRQFRQKYNIIFTVSSAPLQTPESDIPERPVNISGHPENVANCLKEVCNLFAVASNIHTARPDADKSPSPPTVAGGVFRSNWQKNVSGAGVHVHGSGSSIQQSPGGGTDAPAKSQRTNHISGKPLRGHKASPSGRTESNDEGEEILSHSIRECSFKLSNGDTEVHLLVPNDVVGSIIGRQGKTISDIREASHAFISITDGSFPPPPPPTAVATLSTCAAPPRPAGGGSTGGRGARRDRVILVRGPSKSVRTARYLMGSSILNAQRGGGGGSSVDGPRRLS